MALLIILILFVASPSALAENLEYSILEVLYDRGNPDRSVGIVDQTLLHVGDFYVGCRVLAFEDNAIVFEHIPNEDFVKLVLRGKADEKLVRRARHLFVVKQMKAIYEAQVAYLSRFRDHYATDLESLMRQEVLADGFEAGAKQNYYFEVAETQKEFGRDPTFLAVASPLSEIQPDLYFSVDQLGLVRYGDTRYQAPWGPAWEYTDHTGPRSFFIGVGVEE